MWTSRSAAALDAQAPVFAALGDPQRLRIVSRLLTGGPLSIAGMADGAPITRQAVTKHLRVLEAAGIARVRREGREQVWELESAALRDARRQLEAISQQWEGALARLRAFVEEDGPRPQRATPSSGRRRTRQG